MSITVQAKWQPVTIIIDDERTANIVRFALEKFENRFATNKLVGNVRKLDNFEDAEYAMNDVIDMYKALEKICK